MSQMSTGLSRREKRARAFARTVPITPLAVSPLEAARLLSLGESRIYELMRTGALVSYRDGRARRITMASIHDHMARRLAADSDRWHQLNPQPPRRHEQPNAEE